ncbi:MAG: ThiF family adenylyltransferase [Mycobacteriales bacterium]|nr:ThiF family adenylyltransferase [Frankia sp.]
MRPVLKPALRRLWRDATTVQLGVDPQRAVVLHGVSPAVGELLDLLDGTRDAAAVLLEADARGVDPDDAAQLLALLTDLGALDDGELAAGEGTARADGERLAPDLAALSLLCRAPGAAADVLARRALTAVCVVGAGRVGAACGALLAAAGVGQVAFMDEATVTAADVAPGGVTFADRGRPRAAAAAACVLSDGAAHAVVAGSDPAAYAAYDLLVVTDAHEPAAAAAATAATAAGTPYLLAGIRETTGVIGPLVVPGVSSCPRCHDLWRVERDPGWPLVAAQLASGARAPAPGDVVLAAAVAALAAGQALAFLAGPAPARCLDATLELTTPDWRLRRRAWRAHAECDCRATTGMPAA